MKPVSTMWQRLGIVLAALLLAAAVIGTIAWYHLFREVDQHFDSPEVQFKYGSIGTEAEEGLPYWIWLVLPRVFPNICQEPEGTPRSASSGRRGRKHRSVSPRRRSVFRGSASIPRCAIAGPIGLITSRTPSWCPERRPQASMCFPINDSYSPARRTHDLRPIRFSRR